MSAGRNFINTIILGFALFACFLGAGNLVFAPVTGLLAGREWHLAIFAFSLSGVLLPVMAFVAVARAGGIEGLTSEMGKTFSMLFTSAVVLCTSLFIAAPRAAETIYELGVVPIFAPLFGPVPQIIPPLIFFTAVFCVSLSPSIAVKVIGKYIAPIILVILSLAIANSAINPIDIPADTGAHRLFVLRSAFMDGYRTMDIFAGLVFSGAVFAALAAYRPDSRSARAAMACGGTLIALFAMLFINVGLIYLGATGASRLDAAIGDAAVFTELFSAFGAPVFPAFVAIIACLAAMAGLTAGASHFFASVTKGGLSYMACVAMICTASIITATLDDVMLRHALQVLTVLYPAVIVLVSLNVLRCRLINKGTFIGGVYSAILVGFLDMMFIKGYITFSTGALPFFVHGLAWITPAITCAVLGTVLYYFLGGKIQKDAHVQ